MSIFFKLENRRHRWNSRNKIQVLEIARLVNESPWILNPYVSGIVPQESHSFMYFNLQNLFTVGFFKFKFKLCLFNEIVQIQLKLLRVEKTSQLY